MKRETPRSLSDFEPTPSNTRFTPYPPDLYPQTRDTPILLPPDLRDWVPEDDLVHFLIEAEKLARKMERAIKELEARARERQEKADAKYEAKTVERREKEKKTGKKCTSS